ncbi:MAG: hypothetical protein KDK37_14825, partial [Leptospiraceae bacterium]|nr:hypothetical protein [Leptospiraceae bacterium]
MRGLIYILCTAVLTAIVSPIQAREDWSDLHPEPQKYYGSEKNRKIKTDALILVIEDWEGHQAQEIFFLYKHTNYPRFESYRLFPFFYNLKSKIDERSSFFIMPLPGLFYHKRYDRDETRINSTFWISRQHHDTDENWDLYGFLFYRSQEGPSSDRDYDHAFFPLYYGGSNPSRGYSYSYLIPLYLYEGTTSSKADTISLLLPGLYYSSKDYHDASSVNGTWSEAWHFSPLHYRSSEDNSAGHTSRTGFPVLPFLYANRTTPEYESTNWATLFYSYSSDTETAYISPLYRFESDEHHDIRWLPFYFQDTAEDGYLHIPPLWFSNRDWNGFNNFSLLHYYSYKEDEKRSTFGFPLIPILYAHTETPEESSSNFLTIFHSSDEPGEKSYVSPLYRISNYEDHSVRWLPFYFEDTSKDGYLHIPPLWFSNRSTNGHNNFSPLHYYGYDEEDKSSFFGFPIIPLLYAHSESPTEQTTSILTLFYSTSNDTESHYISPLYRFSNYPDHEVRWFPLYLEDTSENGYFHIPPLWFSSKDESGTTNFSLVHYYSQDGDEEITGFPIIPIIYASKKTPTSTRRNLLTVFYWDADDSGTTTFIPPYYHSRTELASSVTAQPEPQNDNTTPVYPESGRINPQSEVVTGPEEMPAYRRPIQIPVENPEETKSYEDHYNVALLFDWAKKDDSATRFFALPLYYQGFGEDRYLHFVPLY